MTRLAAAGSEAEVRHSTVADLAGLAATFAAAPVETGLGVVPLAVDPGHVRARLAVRPEWIRSCGRVEPVVLCVAADMGVGVGVHSLASAGTDAMTLELRLDFAHSVARPSSELHVEGWGLDIGPQSGAGRAEIRDESGSLVASATGIMSVDRAAGLDPSRRPPARDRLDPRTRVVRDEPGNPAAVSARLRGDMVNPLGTVHGGVLMALGALAQERFRDGAAVTRPLSLEVHFLRPVPFSLGELNLHSESIRRGRRFWTVRTELRRPDGVPVARVTGTSLVVPS